MWWREQNEVKRQQFRDLLFKTKQIEFILGAWAMNDEACPTYSAIVNQFTLGHQWLNNTFGIVPNIGWQIDPFGASSVMPTLYKEMGFKYHVIARIDHQVKERLRQSKSMEFIWRGSKNLGPKSDILTHILYDSYCNPSPFIWENSYFPGGDEYDPFRNPKVTPENVAEVSKEFAKVSETRASAYQTNNLLFTFGCDFTFRDANRFFGNLTMVRDYINQRSNEFNMNIKFATLSEYFEALSSANPRLPLVQNTDFYPYADNDNSYWTGYFISYPNQKVLARQAEAHERSAQILSLISHIERSTNITRNNLEILPLREANGEFQHHDGITGTARKHVRDDYERKLTKGMLVADNVMKRSLASIISSNQTFNFDRISKIHLEDNQSINLLFFNSLGWTRSETVKIKINRNDVTVRLNGNIMPSQINDSPNWSRNEAPYELFFRVGVPALGYQVFMISHGNQAPIKAESFESKINCSQKSCEYINEKMNLKSKFEIGFEYYESYQDGGQKSGAYIFRPQFQNSSSFGRSQVSTRQGILVNEKRETFTPYIHSVLRDYAYEDHFDLDIQVGPLPENQEVILKFKTNIKNGGKFFTDDNALEKLSRTYRSNRVQRAASNYYPVQYSTYIHDEQLQLSVIVDRTVGAASLRNGELEIMIHRRTLFDDARGVDEPLDDRSILKSRIRFILSPLKDAHLSRHFHSYLVNYPLDIFSFKGRFAQRPVYSFLKQEFPKNIHLMNFESILNKQEHLLRFLHVFEKDEHERYSNSQTIHLNDYFKFTTEKIERFSLSSIHSQGRSNETITLSPIEMKTFRIKL